MQLANLVGTSSAEALLPEAELRLAMDSGVTRLALTLLNSEAVLRVLGHWVSESLRHAVPKRRAEFAAGRYAASLALARFGCTEAVGRNSDGAPSWPVGFVGSISHAEQVVLAAVARTETHRGLGLDIEGIVSAATHEELRARVLNSAERALLGSALPNADERARFSVGFSLKESLFKCLYPLCREFFDFEDAEIARVATTGDGCGLVELSLSRALPGGFPAGFALPGRFALGLSHVETVVTLEPRAT